MKFTSVLLAAGILGSACLPASADNQAQKQATTQPAAAAAPSTQPAAITLATFAGKWTVQQSKATGNALGDAVSQAIPGETWTVTATGGKVSITLAPPANARKKATPVTLNVTDAKLDGGKLSLTVVRTIAGKHASETSTTVYQFPLTQDATLTGTFSRDREIPNPLTSVRIHDDGNVTLAKVQG
jgi:hypothetical protein